MGMYGMAGLAARPYSASPVPPVDKVKPVNGALQTKTVKAMGSNTAEEPAVIGNGDFAIQNQSARPSQSMYYDDATNQRVWFA